MAAFRRRNFSFACSKMGLLLRAFTQISIDFHSRSGKVEDTLPSEEISIKDRLIFRRSYLFINRLTEITGLQKFTLSPKWVSADASIDSRR
jgi:hypothetical protein